MSLGKGIDGLNVSGAIRSVRRQMDQLKIHRQDGKIQTEHTYGKDPHPSKGIRDMF